MDRNEQTVNNTKFIIIHAYTLHTHSVFCMLRVCVWGGDLHRHACTCIDEYVPRWCMTNRSPSEWLIILLFSNRYFSIDALWKETQYTHFHNPVHSRWPISACAQCNSSYSIL